MSDAAVVVVVVVVVGGLVLTAPSNWLVRWVLRLARQSGPADARGAGRWIGPLERLLIYVLVVVGESGAAGLVVAAKSVLRFPEISGTPAKIDPEYVLVGSLASWLVAFTVAVGVRLLVS